MASVVLAKRDSEEHSLLKLLGTIQIRVHAAVNYTVRIAPPADHRAGVVESKFDTGMG